MLRKERKPVRACVVRVCGGFTMVELLLVIALIALLAGIGGVMYIGTYRGALVKKAAREFFLAAQYARVLSAERLQSCRIEIDPQENRFALVMDHYDERTQRHIKMEIRDHCFKPVELAEDIKFERIETQYSPLEQQSSDDNGIVFHPDGTTQNTLVQIGDGHDHYTICIWASGRVEVVEGQADTVEAKTIDLDKQI